MPDMTPAPAAQSVTLPQELRALVALSGPLALSNLAQIAMGTTDVMMMGSLGPDTLAAGALGANLYLVALIFGIGLLNATTPMIARELGRGSSTVRGLRRIVQQGFWSAGFIAVPCWLVLWWSGPLRWSRKFGQGVKLGSPLRRTDLNDGQTEAVFGGFQGESCS
jgi:Na+-driven multidrug efflux pump